MSDRSVRESQDRGFTLVELLIVISIIGLLLGILLPAIGGARKQAENIVCASNQRGIAQSALTYSVEHRGWIAGAPMNTARDLLNNPDASGASDAPIDIPGDVTQPFDWAGALAWGYLTDDIPPRRRDKRFAMLNGTGGTLEQGIRASSGLGVLACPRNQAFSVPFLGAGDDSDGGIMPQGIPGTDFQTQLSMSYTSGKEFMWTTATGTPSWARSGFWEDTFGVLSKPSSYTTYRYPGASRGRNPRGNYFPSIDNVGVSSKKIFIADGARFQVVNPGGDGGSLDHDVSARGAHGGAFADTGAWQVSGPGVTKAWRPGRNSSGNFWTTVSFRHGDSDTSAIGNVAFYDGHVESMDIDEARDPALWLPSGSQAKADALDQTVRDRYADQINSAFGGFVEVW